jgi:hypothetical protein
MVNGPVHCVTVYYLVKTLVIRNTAEEAMVSRRHLLKGSDKVPRMTAEVGMRHFIEVHAIPLQFVIYSHNFCPSRILAS